MVDLLLRIFLFLFVSTDNFLVKKEKLKLLKKYYVEGPFRESYDYYESPLIFYVKRDGKIIHEFEGFFNKWNLIKSVRLAKKMNNEFINNRV